tara:strand:- start:73 stop:300 length:228 start_codon:yes stop_codon:yes gene_type:complete
MPKVQSPQSRASNQTQSLGRALRSMHHFEKLGAGGSGIINRYCNPNNTIGPWEPATTAELETYWLVDNGNLPTGQ